MKKGVIDMKQYITDAGKIKGDSANGKKLYIAACSSCHWTDGNLFDLNEGKEEILPDAYISKYAPIAKERAALAGYRLAYLIETIFGKSSNSEEQIHFLF